MYCGAISVSCDTVVDGSSMSFSGTGSVRLLEGKLPTMAGPGSLTLDTLRLPVVPFVADKAANGLELLDGIAALREA